jgi:uncharacterized membrane protein (DUF373 family)
MREGLAAAGDPTRAGILLGRVVRIIEDVVHAVVAILLAALCVVLVIETVQRFAVVLERGYGLTEVVLAVLEQTLLLFILAELLHTVAIAVEHRGALDPVPFLVVGLVAAIRSVLILTAEAERSFQWNPQGIELLILMALILVLAVTAVVWRRSLPAGPPATPPPVRTEPGGAPAP